MNTVDKSNDFLSLNYAGGFEKGKLKLPLPFYVTYDESLPSNLVLHGPSNDLWPCTYRKGDYRIHGLEAWMDFYKVKPYSVVRLYYLDGPNFRFEVFTPYAVEMKYPAASSDICSKNSVYEVDKLCSKYMFNGFCNCSGKYSLLIEANHLVEGSYPKILINEACEKLGLDKSVPSFYVGFEEHQWSISLKWANEVVQFGIEWADFVREAAICVGDLIVLHETKYRRHFKVVVFDAKIVTELEQSAGVGISNPDSKFLKGFTKAALQAGELEIPYVFRRKFGGTIGNVVKLFFGGKHIFEVGYCSKTGMLNGLLQIIKFFHLQEKYILLFNRLGLSTFAVDVYDSHSMNHLRDVHGYSTISDFESVDVESGLEDSRGEDGPGNEIIVIPSSSSDSDDSSDSENDDDGDLEDNFAFNVLLKRSHVDNRGHGMYIPPPFWTPSRQWDRRTNVALVVGDHAWEVEVLRFGNQARFAKGWNDFVSENQLSAGSRIFFFYVGDLRFEVRITN